jgi:hypothetical protein
MRCLLARPVCPIKWIFFWQKFYDFFRDERSSFSFVCAKVRERGGWIMSGSCLIYFERLQMLLCSKPTLEIVLLF